MKRKMLTTLATLLLALAAGARWTTPVDPHGPDSGAGRTLAATWDTPAINEAGHPNSGAGRTPWGDPASGPGRAPA